MSGDALAQSAARLSLKDDQSLLMQEETEDNNGHQQPERQPHGPPNVKPLKLRIGQFNLLNFNAASVPFYQFKHGYSADQVKSKVEWTASQLRRMNAAIVGFEEVFDQATLVEAVKLAGYDMKKTTVLAPGCDGTSPRVGLLSVYPVVEWMLFTDFPDESRLDLSMGGAGTQPTFLPLSQFSRPILRVVVRLPTGHDLAVYVTHMKSKRPLVPHGMEKDPRYTAVGVALSLTVRAAEAAALRCLLLDEIDGNFNALKEKASSYNRNGSGGTTKGLSSTISPMPSSPKSSDQRGRGSETNHQRLSADRQSQSRSRSRQSQAASTKVNYPAIVMGDLNDVTHAVTTEIVSGTAPFKRLPFWEKQIQWHSMFYSIHDVQARTADRDVNYTYIHNGKYECLDNILVSNALVRSNPSHIGYVQYAQYFNDHLVDQTLAEADDEYDSPLTLPAAPPPGSDPGSNNGGATRPHKLRGRDVTKSDHGQVVALIKVFPKGVSPSTENRGLGPQGQTRGGQFDATPGATNELYEDGEDDADIQAEAFHSKRRINWDLLDNDVATQLKDWLNTRFAEIQRPDFLGPIRVTELDFGDTPPFIEIQDIIDPIPEFYLPEEFDIYSSPSQEHLNQLLATAENTGRELYLPPTLLPEHGGAEQDFVNDVVFLHAQAMRRESDVQVELFVEYKGNLRLGISTELIVNQPTPAFITLPVTLTLTGFSFSAVAMICYLGNKINFCFRELENGEGLLQDISIESEVGDKNRQVLKNVSKIEKFVVEQLRNLLLNNLVFPNYHSLSLLNPQDDDETYDDDQEESI